MHRPGKQQGLSDALSRGSNLMSKEGEVAYDQQRTTLLRSDRLQLKATYVSIPFHSSFLEEICTAGIQDLFVLDIKQGLSIDSEDYSSFKIQDNLLYFEERLYIPDGQSRLGILQSRYDLHVIKHFGFNKTLELVSRDFGWPQMWKAIKEFVTSYDIYSRSKNPRHRPYGLL